MLDDFYFIVITLLRPTTCQVALAVLHAWANRVGNVPQTIDWLYPPRHTPSEVRLFLLPRLCQWVAVSVKQVATFFDSFLRKNFKC